MVFCVKGLYAKSPPIVRVASVVHFHWTHICSLPNLGLVDSSEWTKRICMSVILSCDSFQNQFDLCASADSSCAKHGVFLAMPIMVCSSS